MKIHHLFILSAGLLISANAMADGADLAKKNGCMTCHAVDKKGPVGPSFKDIANKYAQDTEAAAKLAKKVREGGSGSFGKTPMLAQKNVSDDDIKTIVAWILQLK